MLMATWIMFVKLYDEPSVNANNFLPEFFCSSTSGRSGDHSPTTTTRPSKFNLNFVEKPVNQANENKQKSLATSMSQCFLIRCLLCGSTGLDWCACCVRVVFTVWQCDCFGNINRSAMVWLVSSKNFWKPWWRRMTMDDDEDVIIGAVGVSVACRWTEQIHKMKRKNQRHLWFCKQVSWFFVKRHVHWPIRDAQRCVRLDRLATCQFR